MSLPTSLSICVYCGSGDGRDPAYVATAEQLGRAIAKAGHRLVYGGGNRGLMGTVARGVKAGGGHVTGIIPHFLITKEKLLSDADEIILVNDMHERKMKMFEKADAFVALPGGIGTLEELVEQMTWAQLGRHNKPIVMADIKGFWRPMMDLLAHMRMEGFIREGLEVKTLTAEKIIDVVPMIESWVARYGRQSGTADWTQQFGKD
ncbi:MAG: TIGR00730 family Rossman fold protein [Beijerinckiaceae bacterium]